MKRRILIIAITLMGLMACLSSSAQESKFKALFISKFAEYIEWPDGSKDVTIGVVGKSPVFDELSAFASKKSNITVIVINSPTEVTKCRILFLPETQNVQVGNYKAAIGTRSILLVSEERSLVGIGSDIGFFTESGKVQFKLSEPNIKQKSMIVSAKLLSLAN
jgi:hypothetical protein